MFDHKAARAAEEVCWMKVSGGLGAADWSGSRASQGRTWLQGVHTSHLGSVRPTQTIVVSIATPDCYRVTGELSCRDDFLDGFPV